MSDEQLDDGRDVHGVDTPGEEWVCVGAEHHKGTEWTLWRWSTAPDFGKVEANGAGWYVGDFARAANLWMTATGQ